MARFFSAKNILEKGIIGSAAATMLALLLVGLRLLKSGSVPDFTLAGFIVGALIAMTETPADTDVTRPILPQWRPR